MRIGMIVARQLFILLVLSFVIACERSRNSSEGTQHTGGGLTHQSSPEDVNKAIEQAIALALEPDWSKNVFAQFVSDKRLSAASGSAEYEFFSKPKFLYPNIGGKSSMEQAYSSPMLLAFKTNPIELIQNGDCPRPKDTQNVDASVSDKTLSAKICFSVGNLTKLAPSILLREVLGLLLHEATHLGGASDSEAQQYQKYFTDYFSERFGDMTLNDFSKKARILINEARVQVSRAKIMAEADPNSKEVFAQMGSVLAQLKSVPYMDDSLAIHLKAKPKYPQVVENFWIAINLLSQQITASFEPPNERTTLTLVTYLGRLIYPDEVPSKISEIDSNLKCLQENLEAFDSGILRKECLMKSMTPLEKWLKLPRRISFQPL